MPMSVPPTPPARKAVANLVSALSGWSIFAIFTGEHSVSWAEAGFLVTILTGAFLTWYVPNNIPAPWQPRDRGEAGKTDMGDALALLVVVLCLLLVLRAFGALP